MVKSTGLTMISLVRFELFTADEGRAFDKPAVL
jgi:hypothetical protein